MKKLVLQESFILIVLKWLDLYFLQSGQLHYAERLVKKYFVILRSRGKKEAIDFCKSRRASILRWLTTIRSLDKKSRSLSSVGLPKDLRFLKHLVPLRHALIRLTLSALYVSRNLELPPILDQKSIVGEPTFSRINHFGILVPEFWKALGIHHKHDVPKRARWLKYHLSTKSGPNGQALWSSVADLSVIPDSLVESIGQVGGEKLLKRMKLLKGFLGVFLPFFQVIGHKYRKVVAISDVEGKTREIAILDYWSQTSLRGLHQYLFGILRKIPQDCTFDQGSFQDKIKGYQGNGEPYYSIDLTRATDRFPIDLIILVLEGRFHECFVKSWRDIMVGYPFSTPSGDINYRVGNPMGAYSSWNSFALSHHYVMFWCARELGMEWRDAPYVLLGDDIVIKHEALAKKYMEVMTTLGVEFSLEKSHICEHMFEFAKRNFHNDVEITPFPISAIYQTRRTPSLMLNVIINEERKGWISPLGTPTVASEIYRMRGFNATYVAKKRQIFYISHQVMMGISGRVTAGQAVRSILVEYYPEKLKLMRQFRLPSSMVDRIAEYWYIAMFRSSLLSSVSPKPDDKPLGFIAEQLVCLVTGRDDTIADAFDLIQALPVLQIHGQVEETYMKVVKGGDEQLSLALARDWKLVLRTLTIPISDQVYISRNQELMVHASFTLAKILRSSIEGFKSLKDLGPLMRPQFGRRSQ